MSLGPKASYTSVIRPFVTTAGALPDAAGPGGCALHRGTAGAGELGGEEGGQARLVCLVGAQCKEEEWEGTRELGAALERIGGATTQIGPAAPVSPCTTHVVCTARVPPMYLWGALCFISSPSVLSRALRS